ncbi:MAG: hypothetical protein A3H72_02795 [Candidatus Doudnabacteria bacterium RIFCSPLOWO2_02_FULL_48_8]|nr:MAG: hypothetical protein A3H72_02795 [Candidatus Doudnabacteria bacterium RIFCSPLOWO2_02_FULL_48_8]
MDSRTASENDIYSITLNEGSNYLSFGSVSSANALVISGATGKVGIGTTNPSGKLEVDGEPLFYRTGTSASVKMQDASEYWMLTVGMAASGVFSVYEGGADHRLVIQGNTGNVGIGTTTPDSIKLDVEDDIEIGTGTTGCVRDADNTTLTGSCVSDERLKKNILAFPDGTLEKLVGLRPVSFEWRNDEYPWINGQVGTNYGLIAQEVEQVFPEMVHIDGQGYKRVSYDIGLTMRLLAGIRELNDKVEMLTVALAANGQLTINSNQETGNSINALNVKAIAGISGKWSISEDGNLVANSLTVQEKICIKDLCVNYDQLKNLMQNNGLLSTPSANSSDKTPAFSTGSSAAGVGEGGGGEPESLDEGKIAGEVTPNQPAEADGLEGEENSDVFENTEGEIGGEGASVPEESGQTEAPEPSPETGEGQVE